MVKRRLHRLPFNFDVDEFNSRPRYNSTYSHTPVVPTGCKWIHGDFKSKKGGKYCGKKKLEGKEWCKKHFFIVYPKAPRIVQYKTTMKNRNRVRLRR